MIKGKVEKKSTNDTPLTDYRKIVALNQSSLKLYETDPLRFFHEFVMNRKKKTKKTYSLLLGSLTDFGVLECGGKESEFDEKFDDRFVLFQGVKGSGQAFLLADYLFEETEEAINEQGVITSSFLDRFTAAFNKIQAEGKYSKKTLEWAIEDFAKSPANDYFETLLAAIGKDVVDLKMIEKGKQLTKQLITDPFTSEIFSPAPNKETFNHFVIEWVYETLFGDKLKCKVEVDQLDIFHDIKEVIISDLKCNFDNEMFDYAYLKYGYYIQNAFYHLAVRAWLDENDMKDYVIKDGMRFIVADTSGNNRRPLVYWTTKRDLEAGLNGFTLRGQRYAGVRGLMEGVNWAMAENIFNVTKENFDNNGQSTLNINYE
jgi:hypothetical protein